MEKLFMYPWRSHSDTAIKPLLGASKLTHPVLPEGNHLQLRGHGRITLLFWVCFCLPSMSQYVCNNTKIYGFIARKELMWGQRSRGFSVHSAIRYERLPPRARERTWLVLAKESKKGQPRSLWKIGRLCSKISGRETMTMLWQLPWNGC